MTFLDDLFEMKGGYVLDFSDRTISAFFAEEFGIDFDDARFTRDGTSKAKRLRCFLQTVDRPTAARVLIGLWDHREILRKQFETVEKIAHAHGRLLSIVRQLEGPAPKHTSLSSITAPMLDRAAFPKLRADLVGLSSLVPQQRGYAFEKFLRDVFNFFGLEARDAFRIRGEQIDGSFVHQKETYLLEAKWQDALIGNEPLHAFHGKVDQKAAWARGLFISYSGFTEDGLHAFGRAKRVICMDGLDLVESLERELPFDRILDRKVRNAAETGRTFVRVRELF